MTNYTFKPAIRESVGLLIGVIGPSGAGKTMSAMRIASGIVGSENRFAVIDTENRRALHYADMFSFDHLDLQAPFRPSVFADAIHAADKAGYKAIMVDSASLEWSGEGGVIDWQEEELDRMAGQDYRKREACKFAAWIAPKRDHKSMVQKLLQVRSHLILCFRAEERMKIEKDEKGKTQIVPVGFQPICSKELPYELVASFMLSPDKPGIGQPIKLQEQHKSIFPSGQLLDESCGKMIAEWAKGCAASSPEPSTNKPIIPASPDQIAQMMAILTGKGITDKIKILAELSNFYGRGIGSSKELTSTEADIFISAKGGINV